MTTAEWPARGALDKAVVAKGDQYGGRLWRYRRRRAGELVVGGVITGGFAGKREPRHDAGTDVHHAGADGPPGRSTSKTCCRAPQGLKTGAPRCTPSTDWYAMAAVFRPYSNRRHSAADRPERPDGNSQLVNTPGQPRVERLDR